MQTVLRIFHLKADKMRQLYQQLRNKYQMHCAYAQGNAKMREALPPYPICRTEKQSV